MITTKILVGKLGNIEYIPLGLVKGRNTLAREGFTVCRNPMYMTNGKIHAHYSKTLKYWIIER